MAQGAVEQFLWEELGYRRISDLLEGKKDRRTGIRDFLQGTVFATFRPFGYEDGKEKRVTMPGVPKIHTKEEFEVSRSYSSFQQEILDAVLQLPFFTQSLGFFNRWRRDEMIRYLGELGRKLFPNGVIALTKIHGKILDNDFYFGLAFPPSTAAFDAYFNVDSAVVDHINRVVTRYHGMLHQEKNLDYKTGQVYNQVPEIDLASMVGTIPDEELMRVASQIERLDYTPMSYYRAGQVVNHPRWGLGIIQATEKDRFQAYFPELSVSKILMHNKS